MTRKIHIVKHDAKLLNQNSKPNCLVETETKIKKIKTTPIHLKQVIYKWTRPSSSNTYRVKMRAYFNPTPINIVNKLISNAM